MEKDIAAVEEQYKYQKTEWILSWIAWFLMALFIAVGLSGLLGAGPLSKKVLAEEGIKIEYEKYLRHSMQTEIIADIVKLGIDSSISINKHYVDEMKIDQVFPVPRSMKMAGDKLVLKFASIHNLHVVFHISPMKKGPQHMDMVINEKKIAINQYVHF